MNYVNGNGLNTETIKKDVKKGAQNFSSKIEDATDSSVDTAKSQVARMEGVASDVQAEIQARWNDFAQNAQLYREMAEGYVKKNPATTVLGAAAVGLVAGSLITLALRSSRK
jgi:ElaB/YqjD/DUF883 family membrane-anchored ribosome-binding protein